MKQIRSILITFLLVSSLWSLSNWQTMAAPAQQQAELAFITFPGDNEVVRGVISITGSAAHPAFDRFQIAYAREPVSGNNAWTIIGVERREQIINGELAVWDTRTVPDGSYSLRLRVIRLDGNYGEIEARQIVVANTQPTPTPTSAEAARPAVPTTTPTPLPPTPTIVIEQPIIDTPTPRALAQVGELPTPRPTDESAIPIPKVVLDTAPIKSGCLWGGGAILFIFLLFGFLSSVRMSIMGLIDRTRGRRQ
jgi:hypothetical protein